MRKTLLTCLAFSMGIGLIARAEDAPTEVTAQLKRGLRMKLVPPPAPKPADESDDPLATITDKMTDIVGDLADQKTDVPVQDKQKQVVAQLDAIIQQIEQQQSKSGKGGKGGGKPMTDSIIASGPGGSGDLRDPRSGTRKSRTATAETKSVSRSPTQA